MVPSISFSKGYLVAGAGSGGDAGTGWKIEAGGFGTEENKHNTMGGIGMMITSGRDQTPSGLLDYPHPFYWHNILGEKKKGEEYGFYGKYGFEAIPSSGLFVFGTLGFSMGEEIILAQSTATGWYYTQSKETKLYGIYGGGLAFTPKGTPFMIQAEYQSRIGFMGSIGITW
jgi:hypothetical protein